MSGAGVVHLARGREKSLRHRHPWVFSGAIARVEGDPEAGDIVDVVDAQGAACARGMYNPNSKIGVRALVWDDEIIDDDWWHRRVRAAIDRRAPLAALDDTDAYRLVGAEADGLPGLVVDRYRDVVAIQITSAGIDRVRDVIVDAVAEAAAPDAIYERSDTTTRAREKLAPTSGWLRGQPREKVDIQENGLAFSVQISAGQKTGFYLDQRDNRAAVAVWARGRTVLDAFSYTGGFSVYAARAGASALTLVDTSEGALATAMTHLERNGLETPAEFIQADVFEELRALRESKRRFGLIVLDPPKFATTRRQVDKALRGYKDINMLALQLLEPGGILATFSCSGAVDIADFTRALSWGAIDSGRETRILRRLGQPLDHPVLPAFPESEYLKGLVCQAG